MERHIFECKFELFSSHIINEVGFQGASIYNLEEGVLRSCPLGSPNTKIELSCTNRPDFIVRVESLYLKEQVKQVLYLKRLASYLSFVAAKNEPDGYYGTPFIKVHFDKFLTKAITIEDENFITTPSYFNSSVEIKDSLSIKSISRVRFNNDNIIEVSYNEVLDYYYNGLTAESGKSKFFHWFLIIEYLEGCGLYSELFPSGTMFSEGESNSIRCLANNFSNDKRNVLLSVLTRTALFRNQKLFKLLSQLGITQLKTIIGVQSITLDIVKSVTTARNKIFHRGNEFPNDILWNSLFPLVTLIVEKIIQDPNCIDGGQHIKCHFKSDT